MRELNYSIFICQYNLANVLVQLRSPWSLNCQAELFQHLSRPAEIAIPHARHQVDLQVLVRRADGTGRQLIDFDGRENGFFLVGRRASKGVTRLVMSSKFAKKLRGQFRAVIAEPGALSDETRDWLSNILDQPALIQALRARLEISAKSSKRPQVNILDGVGVVHDAAGDGEFWREGNQLASYNVPGQNANRPYQLVVNIRMPKPDADDEQVE